MIGTSTASALLSVGLIQNSRWLILYVLDGLRVLGLDPIYIGAFLSRTFFPRRLVNCDYPLCSGLVTRKQSHSYKYIKFATSMLLVCYSVRDTSLDRPLGQPNTYIHIYIVYGRSKIPGTYLLLW